MIVRRLLVVSGRVQGVGFRVSCAREAGRLGVNGFVRNRPDGTVEVVAEGETSAVEALETWCGRGPTFAQVRSVAGSDEPPAGDTTFRIV